MENEFIFDAALLPEGAIVLTRAEMDALNEYSEKVKRETVKAIFSDIEELLRARYRLEGEKARLTDSSDDRKKHYYGESLCTSLIIDLQKIEKKYTEE